jgi:hypothetical protein
MITTNAAAIRLPDGTLAIPISAATQIATGITEGTPVTLTTIGDVLEIKAALDWRNTDVEAVLARLPKKRNPHDME